MRDIVIVDTAGRLGIDAEMMAAGGRHPRRDPARTRSCSSSTRWSARTRSPPPRRSATAWASPASYCPSWTATPAAARRCRCAQVTGQPILFASTGEKLEDFDVFHPDRMASRILGMGDVLTLIEQAEAAFDEEQKERMTAKLLGGEPFTLEDFLDQITARPPDGPDRQRAGHDARHGPDQGPAGRARRPALRQGHRDHPVDDPGRAHQPEDHQRLPPGRASPTAPASP